MSFTLKFKNSTANTNAMKNMGSEWYRQRYLFKDSHLMCKTFFNQMLYIFGKDFEFWKFLAFRTLCLTIYLLSLSGLFSLSLSLSLALSLSGCLSIFASVDQLLCFKNRCITSISNWSRSLLFWSETDRFHLVAWHGFSFCLKSVSWSKK